MKFLLGEVKDVVKRVWTAWKDLMGSKTTQTAVGTAIFSPIATVLANKVCFLMGATCDVAKVEYFLMAGAAKVAQQALKDFGATAASSRK